MVLYNQSLFEGKEKINTEYTVTGIYLMRSREL